MTRILLLTFTLCVNFLHAQINDIEWSYTYGGSNTEEPERIIQTDDGNYVVVGYTSSTDGDIGENNGDWDILVMKLDQTGSIIWKKIYGEERGDFGRSIIQTSDGGFILIGDSVKSTGWNTWQNIRVIKLDENGDRQWEKEYEMTANGTKMFQYGYDIKETEDGGYIFVGKGGEKEEEDGFNSYSNYYVVKLNATGETEWEKSYGGSLFTASPRSIEITNDGGYIIAGDIITTHNTDGDGDITGHHFKYDIWVIRLDSNGNLMWQKALGGNEWEKAGNIVVTDDGSFVIGGYTGSTDGDVSSNIGLNDYWVIKLNGDGEILWEKTYGSNMNDEAYDMKQAPNGDLYLIGFARTANGDVSQNFGVHDYWLLQLDSEGNLLNEKSFGGQSEDRGKSLNINENGSIILAGMSNSDVGDDNDNYGYDYWIIQLGGDMNLNSEVDNDDYSVYPKVTKDYINVESKNQIKSIQLISLNGNVLINKQFLTDHKIKLNFDFLTPGIYVLKTQLKNGKIYSDKIIKK